MKYATKEEMVDHALAGYKDRMVNAMAWRLRDINNDGGVTMRTDGEMRDLCEKLLTEATWCKIFNSSDFYEIERAMSDQKYIPERAFYSCRCRKCGDRVLCDHGKSEKHHESLCGNCV